MTVWQQVGCVGLGAAISAGGMLLLDLIEKRRHERWMKRHARR